jgi:hypothetical protein
MWAPDLRSTFYAAAALLLTALLPLSAKAVPPPTQCVSTAIAGGTADAITIPQLPCIPTTTLLILTTVAANVTPAPTIAAAGGTPLVVKRNTGAALAPGDLAANARMLLTSNGLNWFLLNPGFSGTGHVAAQAFGAKGDGITDDSQAIANAFAACGAAGGGDVFFAPTGHPYRIVRANLINPQSGCGWLGVGTFDPPSNLYDNVESDWTKSGSWIKPDDQTNSPVVLTHGGNVVGLNFWYPQPTPSSTVCLSAPCAYVAGWTPTAYPYTIVVPQTSAGVTIANNVIVNGYDCIDLEGTGNGIAAMRTSVINNLTNCFDREIKFDSVDNTLVVMGNRHTAIWFQGSLQVLNYVEGTAGHGIGWDVSYLANVQALGNEFAWKRLGILLTDGTANNGFGSLAFAGANWQFVGNSFNEVCQAMKVASGTTHFAGGSAGNGVGLNILTNTTAFADTNTSNATQCAGATPIMFDFSSDNVGVQLDGLNLGEVNTIAKIGNGSSGYLRINGARAQSYSTFNAGQAAFIAANGAYPDIPGDFLSVVPAASAGPFLSGFPLAPYSMLGEAQIGANVQQTANICQGTLPASPSAAGMLRRWCWRKDVSNETGSNTGSDFALDAYNDDGTYHFSPFIATRANGGVAFGGNVSMNGTANSNGSKPAIASGFGSSPSVAGSDNAGRITVGSAPGATGTLTFGLAFAAAPACTASDETTATSINPLKVAPTTTQLVITSASANFTAADKISFVCIGIQ